MTMKNKLIQISAWIAAHITLVVVLVTAVALLKLMLSVTHLLTLRGLLTFALLTLSNS
jgi:hypothetical protein